MSIQWDRPERTDTPAIRMMKDVMNEEARFFEIKTAILDNTTIWAYGTQGMPSPLFSANRRSELKAPWPLVLRFRDMPGDIVRLDLRRWQTQRNPLQTADDTLIEWGMPDAIHTVQARYRAKLALNSFARQWRQYLYELPREALYPQVNYENYPYAAGNPITTSTHAVITANNAFIQAQPKP